MKILKLPRIGQAFFLSANEGIAYHLSELHAQVVFGPNHWELLRRDFGWRVYWKDRLKYALNTFLRGAMGDLGVVCRRVVTDAGADFIADDFNGGTTDVTTMNYHDSGTGTNAEAAGDTTLQTQAGPTTRATGTQSQPASKQYRSVATIAYTSSLAITEHGLFSQAAQGGTLFDRSIFSAINVVNGDSIQFTYTLTINSGG